MAEMNGIAKAGHVRDKLVHLIRYAETLRGLTHYAAMIAKTREAGIAVPDTLYVNMAKYHFAHGYHEAIRDVQDIAGGALVTGPGAEDLGLPRHGGLLRQVLRRPQVERRRAAQGAGVRAAIWWRRSSGPTRRCWPCTPRARSKPRSRWSCAATTRPPRPPS